MVDWNDLQREWDSQPEYPEERMNQIADLVQTRSGHMRSILSRRDMGEAFAGIFIIVVFGAYLLFETTNTISVIGVAVAIAGALEIIVLTQLIQRWGRTDFASVPLKEFLSSEVRMLNREILLLRYVAWWYLLPLYTGACLFVIGIGFNDDWESGKPFAVGFCVVYLVFCIWIWRLNQKARRKTLEPLRDAMRQTYDGLSNLDSEGSIVENDLGEALRNPALDEACRPTFRLLRPSWHRIVVIVLACIGGFATGVVIQQNSGEPMRFEEWPLLGLLGAATIAYTSLCVRLNGEDQSIDSTD